MFLALVAGASLTFVAVLVSYAIVRFLGERLALYAWHIYAISLSGAASSMAFILLREPVFLVLTVIAIVLLVVITFASLDA